MGTTSRGYPYPALTDAPNGPSQLQSLATAIDSDVGAVTTCLVLSNTTATTLGNNTEKLFTTWSAGATVDTGDLSQSGGIITIGSAGVYRWDATIDFATAATGSIVQAYVKKNGSTQLADGNQSGALSASHVTRLNPGGTLTSPLSAGDTLQLAALSLDAAIVGSTVNISFAVTRVA